MIQRKVFDRGELKTVRFHHIKIYAITKSMVIIMAVTSKFNPQLLANTVTVLKQQTGKLQISKYYDTPRRCLKL